MLDLLSVKSVIKSFLLIVSRYFLMSLLSNLRSLYIPTEYTLKPHLERSPPPINVCFVFDILMSAGKTVNRDMLVLEERVFSHYKDMS